MTDTDAVPMQDVLYVLALARDGRLKETNYWTTDEFASAVWNGFLTKDDMALTPQGVEFLKKFEFLLPKGCNMKRRIMVDITDPDNVFVHKGGRRKNRVYVAFYTESYAWWMGGSANEYEIPTVDGQE